MLFLQKNCGQLLTIRGQTGCTAIPLGTKNLGSRRLQSLNLVFVAKEKHFRSKCRSTVILELFLILGKEWVENQKNNKKVKTEQTSKYEKQRKRSVWQEKKIKSSRRGGTPAAAASPVTHCAARQPCRLFLHFTFSRFSAENYFNVSYFFCC